MEGGADEDHDHAALPNLLQLSFYLEQAGVGLSREEMIRVWLALRTLVESQPVEHVRFWGKIFGTERNYIVAEVQWREGEGDDDEMEVRDANKYATLILIVYVLTSGVFKGERATVRCPFSLART